MSLDIGRAVTYPFEDEEWRVKLLPLLLLSVIPGLNVLTWLETLPPALIRTRPVLCLIMAGLLTISGRRDRMEEIQELLQAAYEQLAEGNDTELATLAWSLAIRVMTAARSTSSIELVTSSR